MAVQHQRLQTALRAGVAMLQNGVAVSKYSKAPVNLYCVRCNAPMTQHKINWGAKWCSPACSLNKRKHV